MGLVPGELDYGYIEEYDAERPYIGLRRTNNLRCTFRLGQSSRLRLVSALHLWKRDT